MESTVSNVVRIIENGGYFVISGKIHLYDEHNNYIGIVSNFDWLRSKLEMRRKSK